MSITAQCILNLNVFILFFRYDTNLAETVWILSWEVWLSNFKSNSFTQPNCIFPLLLSISKRSDLLLLNVKRYMNFLHCYHLNLTIYDCSTCYFIAKVSDIPEKYDRWCSPLSRYANYFIHQLSIQQEFSSPPVFDLKCINIHTRF